MSADRGMSARRRDGARASLVKLGLALGLALAAAGPLRADEAGDEQSPYLNAMRLMNESRHDEAKAALERLIELEPQHAGAWLDLAITQCALGHAAEAERLFREIEVRFAPSAGILEVINGHRMQGCKEWQAKTVRTVTVTRGTDSNVNQGVSNPVFVTGSGAGRIEHQLAGDFLPKRDSYTQAAFDYTHELSRQGSLAIAQLRVRRHDTLREQDTNALLLALERPLNAGALAARAMTTFSLVSLGGKIYQRQAQLLGWLAPPIPLPERTDLVMSAAIGHIEYAHRSGFDASTGEVGAVLSYRGELAHTQAGLGRLVDHGEVGRLGGNRHGWYGSAQLQPRLSERFMSEFGWTRQNWTGETIYSPGLIDAVRRQSTQQWRAAVSMRLSPQQSVLLEWRQVRNDENISLFQYKSQVLQLSWRWNGL